MEFCMVLYTVTIRNTCSFYEIRVQIILAKFYEYYSSDEPTSGPNVLSMTSAMQSMNRAVEAGVFEDLRVSLHIINIVGIIFVDIIFVDIFVHIMIFVGIMIFVDIVEVNIDIVIAILRQGMKAKQAVRVLLRVLRGLIPIRIMVIVFLTRILTRILILLREV
jgi:hypothetical protein